uniref:Uncharacterized protein n=1 Tax=Arundo donax TaxID=35708 RepID=A0A0A8YMG3_ARUDO
MGAPDTPAGRSIGYVLLALHGSLALEVIASGMQRKPFPVDGWNRKTNHVGFHACISI